jgi:MarR family transcriptional regulator, organic hydroperoxide resistance regulator
MARRGYVIRELDPTDRRSFLVSLTEAGRPVARAAMAAMADVEREALGAVSGAEMAGFRAVVRALTQVP